MSDFRTVLNWSETKEFRTKRGKLRSVRTATVNAAFWSLWSSNRKAMPLAGISLKKVKGQWIAFWWQPKGMV